MGNFVKIELPRHDFGPDDTSVLIDELNGCAFAIVSDAVSHKHVKLVLIVLDGKDHGHGLSDFDDARDLGSPRTFADLNLHPALQIIAKEVGGNGMEHVNLEGSESHGFFVKVVPSAPEFSRLIPNLLDVRIVLNDYRVLDVTSGRSRRPISRSIVIGRAAHAARIQEDLEGRAQVASSWLEMNAVRIRVESFAEYHPIERTIELDVHSHVSFFALNLKMLDLRRVRRSERPIFLCTMRLWWPILRWGPINGSVLQRQRATIDQW